MTSSSYVMPLRVSLYDLDWREEVSCASLLRYFEETAIRASGHLGFGFDWYKQRGQFWVIRTMRLERVTAAHFQDQLQIRTWVSSMTRVRADRNYLALSSDGRIVARATANWVYLDAKTLFPARIAPEIVAMFADLEPPAIPMRQPRHAVSAPAEGAPHLSSRHVHLYEADSARHVNNAVYVDWLEEAVRESLLALGYSLPLDADVAPRFYRHSLEYLMPALPGDQVEVCTQLVARGRSTGYWRQEIRRPSSGDLVARGESITLWIDTRSRPVRWPAKERSS